MHGLKMMCVLAHPDDESLGVGGTLAKYAAESAEICLVTATRGERGRWGQGSDPGLEAVGRLRESELREAARILGVRDLHLLDYVDGDLDHADSGEAVRRIVAHIRAFKPDVVVTFGPDGAYGHPDHVAICQLATAAVAAASDCDFEPDRSSRPHRVSKLYYIAWSHAKWEGYQSAFRKLTVRVDGVERQVAPWPDWAITTVIDTEPYWPVVWNAVSCHKTQLALYGRLDRLEAEHHRQLWGTQEFYRVFSLVNVSRARETDLFEGLRDGRRELPRIPQANGAGNTRHAPLDMSGAQFRDLGQALVEQIASFLNSMPSRPVTRASTPDEIRSLLSMTGSAPEKGTDPGTWLPQIADQLIEHSLHNGHPRFWGYITASGAPVGMLADLLAAAVNPNVGAWQLSPLASEIEKETVAWVSDLLGYRRECGGLLVSGGNVANLVCFLAARRAQAGGAIREQGIGGDGSGRLRVYASSETHTWIQKAADISGLGTGAIRWIPVDEDLRVKPTVLKLQIREDLDRGERPFLVVGTAGTVGTGAIDPLRELASICREYGLWFHVDGAYGAPAAMVPGISPDLEALGEADSVAVDPHKWMYLPLEAGCALVARARSVARRILLSSSLLPFRRGGDELLRLRHPELARLPRSQGLDGDPAGRARRIPSDDRRGHPPRAGISWAAASTRHSGAPVARAEHLHVPLRPEGSAVKAVVTGSPGVSRRPEPSDIDPYRGERGGVPVERGRPREIRTAAVHRELQDDARRCPRAPGDRRTPRPRLGP